jgi:hypothetical protein
MFSTLDMHESNYVLHLNETSRGYTSFLSPKKACHLLTLSAWTALYPPYFLTNIENILKHKPSLITKKENPHLMSQLKRDWHRSPFQTVLFILMVFFFCGTKLCNLKENLLLFYYFIIKNGAWGKCCIV